MWETEQCPSAKSPSEFLEAGSLRSGTAQEKACDEEIGLDRGGVGREGANGTVRD